MSASAEHVALHGGYHDNNFGDLLLLALFERQLSRRDAAPVRCSFPLVPGEEVVRFRTHLPGALTGRRQLLRARGLIYAGGGHFGEPDADIAHAYGAAWGERFLRRHVLPARVFRLRRRPWLIAGVGAGPLAAPRVRDAARRIFDGAWAVSVRDEASARFLVDDLGVEREPLVCPDPALALHHADIPAEAWAAADATLAALEPGPVLGIHHPRDWLLETVGARAAREALHERLASERNIVPLVFSDNAAGDAARRMAAGIESACGRPCAHVGFDNVWRTVALIGRLQAVLTTKLHVGIVAWALGVHAASFAIHRKVPRLYRQIEHEERCLMLRDASPEEAGALIDAAIEAACRTAARAPAGRSVGTPDAEPLDVSAPAVGDASLGARTGASADVQNASGRDAGEPGVRGHDQGDCGKRERLRAAALGNAALVSAYLDFLRDPSRSPPELLR